MCSAGVYITALSEHGCEGETKRLFFALLHRNQAYSTAGGDSFRGGDRERKVRATQGITPANGRGVSFGKRTESATESYTAFFRGGKGENVR